MSWRIPPSPYCVRFGGGGGCCRCCCDDVDLVLVVMVLVVEVVAVVLSMLMSLLLPLKMCRWTATAGGLGRLNTRESWLGEWEHPGLTATNSVRNQNDTVTRI